jgi:hypothetical protein
VKATGRRNPGRASTSVTRQGELGETSAARAVGEFSPAFDSARIVPNPLSIRSGAGWPIRGQAPRRGRQISLDDLECPDRDRGLEFSIQRMEMRRGMIGEVHLDQYPVKSADCRHGSLPDGDDLAGMGSAVVDDSRAAGIEGFRLAGNYCGGSGENGARESKRKRDGDLCAHAVDSVAAGALGLFRAAVRRDEEFPRRDTRFHGSKKGAASVEARVLNSPSFQDLAA